MILGDVEMAFDLKAEVLQLDGLKWKQHFATHAHTLYSGLGPLIFSGVFSFFTSDQAPFQYPAAPFVVAAICLLAALVIAYLIPETSHATILVSEDAQSRSQTSIQQEAVIPSSL